jgi:hypothetical protein
MTTETKKPSTIAKKILEDMGGNAIEICNGDCTTFAKMIVDACGGVIVNHLASEMQGEIDGYPQAESEEYFFGTPDQYSHCWVKIDGLCYDAFNPEGAEEDELVWWNEVYG